METNLPEGFHVFAFPEPVRKRLGPSNLCEALHRQIRRPTRVAAIFPNPESCLRPASGILMETSEPWETSKAYLNPKLVKSSSTTSTNHSISPNFYGQSVA